jgi:hypothetical protein
MTSGKALWDGFAMARRTRSVVWVLLAVNLGLAALAALPVYLGILDFTGYSLMSQKLAAEFSPVWLTDFAFNSRGSLSRYAGAIVLIGMVSIPVNSVLAGGVLARFRAPAQAFSIADFFSNAWRYGWRLVRLMIIGLLCYWLVFRALDQGVMALVDRFTRDWLSDRAVFKLRLAASVPFLLGLGFVNLVLDYARVRLVLEEGVSAIEAFLASLGFSLGRFRRAVVVYGLPSLGGIALLAAYNFLVHWYQAHAAASGVPVPHSQDPLGLILLFIAQQLVMFGRYWFRVATWAGEWSYYSGNR